MKTSLTKATITLLVFLVFVIGASSSPSTKTGKGKQPGAAPKAVAKDCAAIDDATLTADVGTKISSTPGLNGQNVNAAAHNRVVTLTGNVSSGPKKQLANNTAAGVMCVRRVVNRLDVTAPMSAEGVCCCDGVCWFQNGRCPICDTVKSCVDAYKAAIAKAGANKGLKAEARRDFLACTCKATN
jgi:hypothetical protein